VRVHALLASLCLVAGCDRLLGLEDVSAGPPDAPSGCPPSYVQLSSGYYRFSTDRKYFADAEQDCAADTAQAVGRYTHLAVTDSPQSATQELAVVYAYAQTVAPRAEFLVGLTDARTANTATPAYRWVTDEPVLALADGQPPWDAGCQPECPTIGPGCPEARTRVSVFPMYGDGYITEVEFPLAYVCECDAFPEDPQNF
jgi:hypothetical protein